MEEKKTNRRVALKFALITLGSLIVGVLLGLGIIQLRIHGADGILWLLAPLSGVLPVFGWVAGIAAFLIALRLYFRCKGQLNAWDGEDEAALEAIEQKLNTPLTIANVSICINFLYFTLLTAAVEYFITPGWYIVGIVAFLFNLYAYLTITYLVVGLEKKINPEKKGNVLDTKFQKDWMNSCDEAEQKTIWQAGFQGYRAGSLACLILWMVCTLAQMAGLMGPWPGIMLALIWLTMIVSYTVSCIKLNRKHGPL